MTRKAKKGKRKKQKAGLNKSILDVGFGMLKAAIKYKVEEGGGQFIEIPTKKVKPSQTCPKCGYQHPKTLDERIHHCHECGYEQDRDIASAEVCLYWVKGTLPGLGTSLVDADRTCSTVNPKERKNCGGYRQLVEKKRQKHQPAVGNAETPTSAPAGRGSSFGYPEQEQTINSHWGYREWLVKYHREYGDSQTALEWQQ